MADPSVLALASTGTLAVAALSGAALKAWNGWLDLHRDRRLPTEGAGRSRSEIEELRARIRRLEAIADG